MTQELDDRFLKFTPDQLVLLRQISGMEMSKRLAVRFTDPANDQENIRRAAYLDGGLDMLQYLLDFDRQLMQTAEELKQETLQNQQDGPSTADLFPSF